MYLLQIWKDIFGELVSLLFSFSITLRTQPVQGDQDPAHLPALQALRYHTGTLTHSVETGGGIKRTSTVLGTGVPSESVRGPTHRLAFSSSQKREHEDSWPHNY